MGVLDLAPTHSKPRPANMTYQQLLHLPAKTNLQDHARLCKNLACKTCMARARDMSLFLHDSCTILQDATYLARNGARNSKLAGNYSCSISCKIVHHFLQEMCKILQDSARIVQEKGHVACTCHASLACKILAQSCNNLMILQVRFCWAALHPERAAG